MALMTMVARVVDGLPLVGTMQDDEQSGKSVLEYQNQAKMLFRKLGPQSPPRCSIETGPYLFHYIIESEVCYLVMCDKMYSKRLAFNYLEDIAQEFHKNYGRKVNSVTRPYAFIEFDVYIQKAKKQLTDRRRNINAINNQLQDVQRIMVQNIDDVLQRGTVLSAFHVIRDAYPMHFLRKNNFMPFFKDDFVQKCIPTDDESRIRDYLYDPGEELDTKTQNLSMLSQKYKKDATYLNQKSMYVKAAAAGIVIFVFILYFWIL